MNKLKEIISYILIKYPHKDEISNARLTKMVYLSDWLQAIKKQKQITNIEWYFDNYGPYVPDIHSEISKHPDLFECKETINMFGGPKTLFSIKNNNYDPLLDISEKEVIDDIIDITKTLNWEEFIKLVYSTYPIVSSERYSQLNLVEKAKEYKK